MNENKIHCNVSTELTPPLPPTKSKEGEKKEKENLTFPHETTLFSLPPIVFSLTKAFGWTTTFKGLSHISQTQIPQHNPTQPILYQTQVPNLMPPTNGHSTSGQLHCPTPPIEGLSSQPKNLLALSPHPISSLHYMSSSSKTQLYSLS